MTKRLFDILVSAVALIVFLPLLLLLALMIRWKIGTPVFFRQVRPGLNGKLFTLIKFRTMMVAYDDQGKPLSDSKRLTPFGAFLRSSSLDELPELWNVLNGSMSLVGPRPLLIEYLPLYDEIQMRRHEMRPGITGWAQVNGRNAISWEEKFDLDVWYIDNQTFLLDLKILLKTILKVLLRSDISQDGHVTMTKFRG